MANGLKAEEPEEAPAERRLALAGVVPEAELVVLMAMTAAGVDMREGANEEEDERGETL